MLDEQLKTQLAAYLERVQQPFELAGSEIAVQLSCGVSLAPQDAHSSEELQRHAEFALEAARSGNGSAVEYYASEQNAAARERHQLAAMLPAALGRGDLAPGLFKGLARLAHGPVDVIGGPAGDGPDRRAGAWLDHQHRLTAGPGLPVPADEQVKQMWNVLN